MSACRLTALLSVLCAASCSDPAAAPPPLPPAQERQAPNPADLPRQSAQQSGVALEKGLITRSPDEACAACHAEIATAYRASGMQRTLTLPTGEGSIEAGVTGYELEAEGTGGLVEISARDGRYVVSSSFVDATGTERATFESTIDLIVGSGRTRRSYFQVREGRLLQLPITWFADRNGVGLSPGGGFDEITRRLAVPLCVACHSGSATRRPGGLDSGFQGELTLGVSCARCHGSDARHVATGETGSIVSPAKLSLERQSDLCAQCHLNGALNLLREGVDLTAYVPGTPLGALLGVFDGKLDDDEADERASVSGHADRLRLSKCFSARPDMTCATCHDPHRVHGAEAAPRAGASGCASCHDDGACKLGAAERGEASCVSCHMASFPADDREHTGVTDHLIRRRARTSAADHTPPDGAPPRLTLLTLANAALTNRLDREDALPGSKLLKAVAYLTGADAALTLGERPYGYAGRAAALAQELLDTDPGDAAALEALGRARVLAGDLASGRELLTKALAARPDSVAALTTLAYAEMQRGEFDHAVELLRHAFGTAPYSDNVPRMLADAYRQTGHFEKGVEILDASRARLGPSLANAQQALDLSRDAGAWDHALASCYDMLLLRPRAPGLLSLTAKIARTAGHDASESRALFDAALALAPQSVDALLGLASLESSVGAKDRARALLERARALAPGDPRIESAARELR